MKKKIYAIYLFMDKESYETKMKYLLGMNHIPFDGIPLSDSLVSGLYGWTDSTKLKDEFLSYRNPEFYRVVTLEPDNRLFHEITIHAEYKINRYPYTTISKENGIEDMEIASTKYEYVNVTSYGMENKVAFVDDEIISENVDYMMFNDEIMKALDIIGYTFHYDMNYGNEERRNNADYSQSYNVSPLGYPNMNSGFLNEVMLFIDLYKEAIEPKIRGKKYEDNLCLLSG